MEKISPELIASERLDRMEHHLKLMKDNIFQISDDSKKISSALIGNEYTGGRGIVHQLEDIKKDVEKNKDDIAILKDNMSLVKWFGGCIGGLVISIVLYILQKQL